MAIPKWAIPFNKHTPRVDEQIGTLNPLDIIISQAPPWTVNEMGCNAPLTQLGACSPSKQCQWKTLHIQNGGP